MAKFVKLLWARYPLEPWTPNVTSISLIELLTMNEIQPQASITNGLRCGRLCHLPALEAGLILSVESNHNVESKVLNCGVHIR